MLTVEQIINSILLNILTFLSVFMLNTEDVAKYLNYGVFHMIFQ